MPMACFVNIMRVTVIFVAARSWGLAIILSSGSVLSPQSMSAADFAALPASIEVRKSIYCSTTRVSSQGNHFGHHLSRLKRYSQARLAQLYQLRWQATEVNFKHLKTTWRWRWFCENSEMVQEIWVHLLAYNFAKLDNQPSKLGCGFPCRGLDNSSISSDLIWLRQPKPSPLHYPARCHQCSPRSLRLIVQNPESLNEDLRVFLGCSNLAQSSKLNWPLNTASVSAIHELHFIRIK